MLQSLTLTPIGIAHTPFRERMETPRQPAAAGDVPATIELFAGRGFEHALSDLEGFDRIWILFWFHLNTGFRPKVLPPRSRSKRRGVFATRSPHRPNPIGLSAVQLDRIDGLFLHIRGADLIDQTPILDIKPYIAYTDAFPGAKAGWLEEDNPIELQGESPAPARDPRPAYEVHFGPRAAEQAAFLKETFGIDLISPAEHILRLGPQPHPYRRIRALKEKGCMQLAIKDWRLQFQSEGKTITIQCIESGYRPRELALGTEPVLEIHRRFGERFPKPSD